MPGTLPPDDADPRPLRLVLVDDDPLTRAAVRAYLVPAQRYTVLAEASDGIEAIDAVAQHAPDVVLMDLGMPRLDGVEATRRICAAPSHPAVVVLTTWDVDDAVVRAVEAGATGYLLKVEVPEQLEATLERVRTGEPALSAQAMRQLLAHVRSRAGAGANAGAQPVAGAERITGREREVLGHLARGLTNEEIGTELFVSASTVKSHVTSAMEKLGARNRTHLAVLAERAGLTQEETAGA